MTDRQRLYSRAKRQGKAVWKMTERIHVPCSLSRKIQVIRLAREHNLSQAEFGLLVMESVLDNETLLQQILNNNKTTT